MAGLVRVEVQENGFLQLWHVWPQRCPAKRQRPGGLCQRLDRQGRLRTCPMFIALCAPEGPEERVPLARLAQALDQRARKHTVTTVICQLASADGLTMGA